MSLNRARSKAAFEAAQAYLPGGVDSPVRSFRGVGGDPVVVASGAGSRIMDVDGNQYIDYCGSWGPLLLGHAHPAVVEAVTTAAARGLEDAHESAPESTADDAGHQDQEQVQAHRQVEREPHPRGQDTGHDDLALGADVEKTRTEGQGHAQARRDERGGDGEGFHEGRELGRHPVAPRVEDRTLEQGNVGPVSYTTSPSPRDPKTSRMPSSA